MSAKTAMFLLGVCVGAVTPLVVRLLRPLSPSVLARGMLAYETACDAVEKWSDKRASSSDKD